MTRTEQRMALIARSLTGDGQLAINNKWQIQYNNLIRHMIADGLFVMHRYGQQSKFKKFKQKKQTCLLLTVKGKTWYESRTR